MKKLFVLVFINISFFCVQAQVLDTLSLEEFKTLKYKQVKALYQNDEAGLELIKKSHTRKINSYIFFGLSVPFAVTLNPSIWMPLTPAVIKLSNNTKKSLYKKLRYYERVKFNLDTIKMVIPEDTNSYKYKYAKYEFDVTLDEFKALGLEKQKAIFNINDTTQFIFDYSRKFKNSVWIRYASCSFFIVSGSYLLFSGVMAYMAKGDMYIFPTTFFLTTGSVFTTIGVYNLPSKKFKKQMDMNRILYLNIQQYYLTHKVYPDVSQYIKYKREQYKPKPLLN